VADPLLHDADPPGLPVDPDDPGAMGDELHDDLVGGETRTFTFQKPAELRLDRYLQQAIGGFSRHQIQRIIELGGVKLNDKPPKPSARLKAGDTLTVFLPPKPSDHLEPEDLPIEVLHEEAGFIVVNKPANMIVHPARGRRTGTLLNALTYHFQQNRPPQAEAEHATEAPPRASASPIDPPARADTSLLAEHPDAEHPDAALSDVGRDDARPGVIHRLDMNTTGVIIVGKREHEHWKLAKQFEHRTNLKCYLALVHGHPDPPGGHVEQPLGRHPTIREAQAVRHDAHGRDSLTLYRTRETYPGYSLVECELKSGRTHQIRVHLAYIGHPLVGDIIYGGLPIGPAEIADPPYPPAARPMLNFANTKEDGLKLEAQAIAREQAGDLYLRTPALHAALLRITHPTDGHPLTFTAPLHEPFRSLVHRLRRHAAELDHDPADPARTTTDGTHIDLAAAIPPPSPPPPA
jgi:23S rRNA pseudouridine1911/1915/1917 synthase